MEGTIAEWHEGDVIANGVRLHCHRTGGDHPPLLIAHGGTDVRRLLAAPDGSRWGEGWDGLAGGDCCYVHVTGNRWVTYTHSAALPVSRELLGDIHRLRD